MLKKSRAFLCGLGSIILSSMPFIAIFCSLFGGNHSDQFIFQILLLGCPPIGFIVAFVGKVRSDYRTPARKLCNIGAGIGIAISAIMIWVMIGDLLCSVASVPDFPAIITGFVDAVLICGYFLIAYIRGRILWFIDGN